MARDVAWHRMAWEASQDSVSHLCRKQAGENMDQDCVARRRRVIPQGRCMPNGDDPPARRRLAFFVAYPTAG